MDVNEAQSIVDQLVEAEKRNSDNEKKYGKEYVEILKQVARIRPHADEDYLPIELINKRAPNATDDQVKYIKENWKCTTIPVFQKLLTVIDRGFIDDNWQIIWSDEASDFQKYIEADFPEYGAVETFVKDTLPQMKYKDANALIAIRPAGFHYAKDVEGNYIRDNEGMPMLDETKRFEPAIFTHRSEDVLIRNRNFYAAVDDEKSLVEWMGREVLDGRIIYIYTDNEIYRSEQFGKKVDNTYRTYLYYRHNEGKVPCMPFGGIPKVTDYGKKIQVSPFRYSTDLLDLALTNKNWLQLSVSSVVFPFKIMMADPCTFADENNRCNRGSLISLSTGMESGTCPKCHGKGTVSPYSPLGTYLFEKPSGNPMEGNITMPKPIEFVEAPTTGLEFVQSLVDRDTTEAESILHLQKSTREVKGSEDFTATGKALNDQGQISFVRYNTNQIFDAWNWINRTVCFQRYDNYDFAPLLVYPQTFDFRSEADIWEQISLARASESPAALMSELFEALLSNMNASSPDKADKFETIINADKLFALSDMGLASRKAGGTVEDWEIVLHDSAIQLVNQLVRDVPNYLDKELSDRVKLLVDLAKSSTFRAETGTNAVSNILNATTNTAQQSETTVTNVNQ